MFGREVVANVLSSDKSISRRLLYFLKCSYVIGPYRMGGGNKWGVDLGRHVPGILPDRIECSTDQSERVEDNYQLPG